jgi:hypothetical protein
MTMQTKFVHIVVGSLVALWSSVALAYPTDLQVRPLYGVGSCDSGVFAAELKIINTASSEIFSSSVFPEFAFEAGAGEIEAVYPQVYASIFDAAGNFVTWTGATLEQSPWTVDSALSSERQANQVWRVRFDPPRAGVASNTIPAGGYVTVAVALRRAGGAVPFDQGCNDFSKVSPNAGGAFVNDPFFHLIFTSTQQLVCEVLGDGSNDAASGISFSAPFTSSCR